MRVVEGYEPLTALERTKAMVFDDKCNHWQAPR